MNTISLNNIKNKLKDFGYINIFFLCEVIFCLVHNVAQLVGLERIASLIHGGIYLLLFFVFAVLFVIMLYKEKHIDSLCVKLILLGIVTFAVITVNYIMKSEASFSASYYSKFIFFIGTSVLFYILYEGNIDIKIIKCVLLCIMTASVIFIGAYVVMGKKAYIINDIVTKYLTYNVWNPNYVAIMLLLFFLYMLIGVVVFEKMPLKIICGVLSVILYCLIVETRSRNVLLIALGFLFVVLFFIYKKRHRIYNAFWAFIYLIPILFAVVYILFIDNESLMKIFSFMASEGKGLDSRKKMWDMVFQHIGSRPLFGSYYELWHENELNLHNTLLDILGAYGGIVFIIFSVYMYDVLRKFNSICTGKLQQIALLAFGMTLLIGMAESAMFSGSAGLFILCGGFLAVIKGCMQLKLWNEQDKTKQIHR